MSQTGIVGVQNLGIKAGDHPSRPLPRMDCPSTSYWTGVPRPTGRSPHPTGLRQGPAELKALPGLHIAELPNRGHPTGARHPRALPGCSEEDATHQPPCPPSLSPWWQGLLAEGTPRLGCSPHHSTQAVDDGGNFKKNNKKPDAPLNISGIPKARSCFPNATNFLSHDACCLLL